MYCAKCGFSLEGNSKYCAGCGNKVNKKYNKLLITLTALIAFLCIGVFSVLIFELNKNKQVIQIEQVQKANSETSDFKSKEIVKPVEVKPAEANPQETAKPAKEVSKIIEEAQPKVFTIFSELGQGSGFLINENGDILTNAHVVEGSINVTVRNHEGAEFNGTIIGYSNEVDIAVIRVGNLAGRSPLALETGNISKLGDEVIALGSPRGYENTATSGNISGVNRSFIIPPHIYDGIYQISAPIAPGSSGGPLIDKKTEKVIAINSARDNQESNIAFSIPLFKIIDIINRWVTSPMGPEEVAALFYNGSGLYFYQELYDNDYYFDGGEYDNYYYELPYWNYYEDSYEWDYTEDYIDDDYYEEEDEYYIDDDYYVEEDEYYIDEEYVNEEESITEEEYNEEEQEVINDDYFEEDYEYEEMDE